MLKNLLTEVNYFEIFIKMLNLCQNFGFLVIYLYNIVTTLADCLSLVSEDNHVIIQELEMWLSRWLIRPILAQLCCYRYTAETFCSFAIFPKNMNVAGILSEEVTQVTLLPFFRQQYSDNLLQWNIVSIREFCVLNIQFFSLRTVWTLKIRWNGNFNFQKRTQCHRNHKFSLSYCYFVSSSVVVDYV